MKHQRAKMRRRADTGVRVGRRTLLLLHPGDQLGGGFRLEIGLADNRHRHVGDAADGVEIVDHVVAEVIVERRGGRLRDMPD
jgi:hypothetical protein